MSSGGPKDGLTIDSDGTLWRNLLERHDVAMVPATVSALRRFFACPTPLPNKT
jgi:sugar lactone lactonase YvrE